MKAKTVLLVAFLIAGAVLLVMVLSESAGVSPAGQRNAASAAVSYSTFVAELAEEHCGKLLYHAMYDPNIINDVASSVARDVNAEAVLPHDNGFVWEFVKMSHRPVTPRPFRSVGGILSLSKQLMSIGLARLHREKQLSLMYAQALQSQASLTLFKRIIRRCLTAYATYFYILMQLTIDAMDEKSAEKAALKALKAKYDPVDPLILIMSRVSHTAKPGDIDAMLARATSIVDEFMTTQRTPSEEKEITSMFPLEYGWRHYSKEGIVNGKFWNTIRPTATCSTLVRLCEVVDGCRFICNAEYLLRAGLSDAGGGGEKYLHKIVGFGSNNEFDWELSIHNMFRTSSKLSGGKTHEIGWMTVFDCTIGPGTPRKWEPVKELTEAPIGFGHVSKCLDAIPNELSISMLMLRPLLRKSEVERLNAKEVASNYSTVGEVVTRYRVSESALKSVGERKALEGPGGVRIFDDLSILKWDVEGYEHNVLPKWARDDLRCLAESAPQKFTAGSQELIDLDEDCKDYATPSLLSLELHRMGHKNDYGASIEGALRAHFTLLHAYSLGYIMVAQEKNHQDYCCYELAFVHVRHFARSELWMMLEH